MKRPILTSDANAQDLTNGCVTRERPVVPATDIRTTELPGRLKGLTLPKQVLVLAIWPLLEQFMNVFVGTVDLSLAGHLQPESLAVSATDGLGVGGFVGWLMAMIQSSAAVGSAALISRAIGGRHRGLANAALGQAIILGAVTGGLVGLAIFLLARPIGAITGLRGDGLALCTMYLRIISLAAPASGMLMAGNAALRAAGDTRSPFIVMIVVNVLNTALSVLFVFGPAPIGGHGVTGIACGTVGAWLVGTLLVLIVLMRARGGIRLHAGRLRPHWHTMRRIIQIALPNLFEGAVGMWLGNFLVLMIVGRLEQEAVLGAHQTVIRVESLSFLPGFAMSIAASTLAGQYLGMSDTTRARRAVFICWAWGTAIMAFMGAIFVIVPELLVRIITNAEPLLELAPTPLRICGPFQVFLATRMILAGALRGAGDTRSVMIFTLTSTFLVRLPAVYVLAVVLDLGLNGVWYGMCGEMVVSAVLVGIRFSRGKWTQARV